MNVEKQMRELKYVDYKNNLSFNKDIVFHGELTFLSQEVIFPIKKGHENFKYSDNGYVGNYEVNKDGSIEYWQNEDYYAIFYK